MTPALAKDLDKALNLISENREITRKQLIEGLVKSGMPIERANDVFFQLRNTEKLTMGGQAVEKDDVYILLMPSGKEIIEDGGYYRIIKRQNHFNYLAVAGFILAIIAIIMNAISLYFQYVQTYPIKLP